MGQVEPTGISMDYPHFSIPATLLALALCAVGAITGIELFFMLGVGLSFCSLVVVVIQGFRD